ncbi:MAG: Gfo/Idh/MocA family oxidoreductase [Gammaproteobacteria bacterium]|nr:Gfo/Idh/MocA family oxidoreductase [Gammaproteobacteria bacterium]
MTSIRTAVIGVGSMGRWHADKYAALPESELVAVVDADRDRAQAVADELGTEATDDFRELIGRVDAVSVVTPTSLHYDVARALLENGIHVLVEKPITSTVDQARALVDLAASTKLVLQVGHLERCNPAVVALTDFVDEPRFIESNRIAPYKPRALDVSVVLDLMIHDIDLVHAFVQSPMESVDAVGRRVFSDNIDVANARIRFASGCVANVTSSRISMKTERSLRIFQDDSYVSADLQNKTLTSYRKRGEGPVSGPQDVDINSQSFGDADALMEQARAFLDSVANGTPPLVSGRTGLEALETATVIGDLIRGE